MNRESTIHIAYKTFYKLYVYMWKEEGLRKKSVDFYVAGRRHDSHVLNVSLFNDRLRQIQVGKSVQHKYNADIGIILIVMGIVSSEEGIYRRICVNNTSV